jgi:hypothetical protein
MVPTFTRSRSTREMPSYAPAASPQVRRRLSPWPPRRPIHSGYGVARPVSTADVHGIPTQIRQVRVGSTLTELHALVPLVHLLVLLAGPAPSGSARASRRCQDCSRPPRRLPDQAVLSFAGLLRQPSGQGLSPQLGTLAPRGARTGHRTGGLDRPPPNGEAWPASPLPATTTLRPGPERRHSAVPLAALQPPSLLATAAALRHVTGSPGPGLLRRLRPTRPVRQSACLSTASTPGAHRPGTGTRWFPCSLWFARRSRSPAVSQRLRHAYAADLQRGLRVGHLKDLPEVPAATASGGTHRARPISTRFEPVPTLKDVITPVPRVLLSATLAGPAPSGSTGTSRLCQGCSHPPRHHPDQAALSFTALLRQDGGEGLSPPLEQQHLTAQPNLSGTLPITGTSGRPGLPYGDVHKDRDSHGLMPYVMDHGQRTTLKTARSWRFRNLTAA